MSQFRFLIGFLIVTVVWRLVAQMAGPPLAKSFFAKKLASAETSGLAFESEDARNAWAQKAAANSMNISLLLLAAACGAVAGLLNFPLVGFSASLSGWSWLRIIVLCGVSWIVALALYSGSF
jgi:hypothetical protein